MKEKVALILERILSQTKYKMGKNEWQGYKNIQYNKQLQKLYISLLVYGFIEEFIYLERRSG